MMAEPAAPRGRDPFVPLQFAYRPGNGMAKANCSEGPSVMVVVTVMPPMVVPFVMAAPPVPSIVMTAASMPTTVMPMAAVSMAMMPTTVFDLDCCSVRRGQGRDADSGGSGQGHCQRGNQCRADQNDTSHAGVLPIAGSRSRTSFHRRFCSTAAAAIAELS